MGQKINPIGFRLGINRGWDSTWFAKKKDFGNFLIEDFRIREYIKKNVINSGVSKVMIERTSKKCFVTIYTSRPGFVIGKKGSDIEKIKNKLKKEDISCIFLDEAQFLTKDQVWALARAVDDLGVPIMCYGLRVDFMGELFPGSAALLALADEMREIRTICHCGKKATMVVRLDSTGKAMTAGDQVQIGGNETYLSLCRKHYREAVQDNTISELPM